MENRIINSVAMATYNGEKYIKEQIDSILINIGKNDELIISDDGSTDGTINIINDYIKNDKRINLISGPKLGVKQNFANAIKNTKGKYIYLSDQDDVWEKDKIKKILQIFEKEKCNIVVHNADIVDSNLNKTGISFFEFRKSGKGKLKNIFKNTYIGCCMAFDSNLKDKILPVPNNIEMHDQWIGILGEKYGKSIFIDECLIKYRRHETNLSKMDHYPISKMIKNRILFIKEYIRK